MDATQTAVREVRTVGPDTVAIDIETPAEFDAQPGQFVKLTFDVLDKIEFESIDDLQDLDEFAGRNFPETVDALDELTVSRFYTISSPSVGDTFEITVEIDPDGTISPVLEDLGKGDAITMSGPFGNDYYEGEESVVVLAGGPGIGPAIGIAERAVDDDHRAAIVYQDDEPVHEERIYDLRKDGASITILSRDGDFEAAVADTLAELGTDSQFFVYGFADFIDEATAAIEGAGGEAETAKIENFG